jgi:hypothetical protein
MRYEFEVSGNLTKTFSFCKYWCHCETAKLAAWSKTTWLAIVNERIFSCVPVHTRGDRSWAATSLVHLRHGIWRYFVRTWWFAIMQGLGVQKGLHGDKVCQVPLTAFVTLDHILFFFHFEEREECLACDPVSKHSWYRYLFENERHALRLFFLVHDKRFSPVIFFSGHP